MISSDCRLLDFLPTYRATRVELAPESLRQVEISLRALERFSGRPLTLADLSEDLVRVFLASYRARVSAATTNSKRRQILAVWRCAWEEGILASPPRSRLIRRARDSASVPEAWTAEEVGRILSVARNLSGSIAGLPACRWWESLLLVLFDTGERRSATMRTSPRDISGDTGSILFRRIKQGRSRLCRLADETMDACMAIHDSRRPLQWPWPWSRELLDRRFRDLLADAGVAFGRGRGGLFHKLRRTAGTLVETNGGDGAKFLGVGRDIFERHYLDPRFSRADLLRLPRPCA